MPGIKKRMDEIVHPPKKCWSLSYLPATSAAWPRIFQIAFGNRPSNSTSAVATIKVAFIAGGVATLLALANGATRVGAAA